MKFSVVLISRNEERTLPRLLASLKGVEDIVLVDTGSTDNTAEVARSHGVRVFCEGDRFREVVTQEMADKINELPRKYGEPDIVHPGDTAFNYSNARNYAVSLAVNDLVFMPDCDEEVTWDLPKLELAITGAERLEYNFVFAHDDMGKPLVEFSHSKFYDRRKFKWVRIIHEVLEGEGQTRYLGPDIIKLDHWQNPSQNRDHYLKGLAIDNLLNPANDRQKHYYARELMYKDRPRSAIDVFEEHAAGPGWMIEQSQSLTYVGECYAKLGEKEKAINAHLRAIEKFPAKRESWNNLGALMLDEHKPTEAVAYLSACVAIPRPNFYATFAPMYQDIPWNNLSIALWRAGRKEEAFQALQRALKENPQNSSAVFNLQFSLPNKRVSVVVPTLGRPEKLKRLVEHIKQNAWWPNYEIIVVHDGEEIQPFDGVFSIRNEERQGVPKTLKRGVEVSSGDLVMYLGNDCIPYPGFMVQALYKQYQAFGEKMDGLVGLNDMYWHGEFATHWLASKDLLPMLDGEFFHTGYNHCGCDNELTERCRKAGKYMWAEHALVYHDHPVQTGFQTKDQDWIYAIAYNKEKTRADQELLHRRAAELGFEIRENFQRPNCDCPYHRAKRPPQ